MLLGVGDELLVGEGVAVALARRVGDAVCCCKRTSVSLNSESCGRGSERRRRRRGPWFSRQLAGGHQAERAYHGEKGASSHIQNLASYGAVLKLDELRTSRPIANITL